jgi:carboxypeptidase C (cathepsin A)
MPTNYPLFRFITEYLSRPGVRTMLGVDPAVAGNFTSCSGRVGEDFESGLDMFHPTYLYVAGLLERGIRVLIYVGKYDWICNWVGNERWTLGLEWSGQELFRSQNLKEWKVDDKVVGETRSARGLTFATVEGAGHMVGAAKYQVGGLTQRFLAYH